MSQVLELWMQANYIMLAKLLGVILLAIIAGGFTHKITDRLIARLSTSETPWDTILGSAIHKPISALFLLLAATSCLQVINQYYHDDMLDYVKDCREILILVLVAWFFIRFLRLAEIVAKERVGKDPRELTTVMAVAKVLRATIIIIITLMALQTLGFSIEGVLAFGGIGGMAVGFAAKDLLANFFGGLMIYLDRPFGLGDSVRSPDRNIEGTVEYIGWRLTLIRTQDKRPLYIPNSVFASIALENTSRMSHRSLSQSFALRVQDADKVEPVLEAMRTYLQAQPELDAKHPVIVVFSGISPGQLNISIEAYSHVTHPALFSQFKQRVLLEMIHIIQQQGAELAYPTTTVQVEQGRKLLTGDKA